METRTMERHLVVIGVLYIVLGALGLLAAALLFAVLVGVGFASQDPEARAITSLAGSAVAALLALLSLPSLIGGIGLLQHKRWAKVIVLVAAIFNLPNFPFGTALALYTLWFVLQPETDSLLAPSPAHAAPTPA